MKRTTVKQETHDSAPRHSAAPRTPVDPTAGGTAATTSSTPGEGDVRNLKSFEAYVQKLSNTRKEPFSDEETHQLMELRRAHRFAQFGYVLRRYHQESLERSNQFPKR